MNKIIYIFLLLSLYNCTNNNKTLNKKPVTKTDTVFYKYKGFNNGIQLYLLSNKKFIYKFYSYGCTGGGEDEKVTGTYKRKDNQLLLVPDSVNIKVYDNFVLNESNVLKRKFKTYKLKYKDDSLRIKTKYEIIEWNNMEYLLSPQKDIQYRPHNPGGSLFFEDSIMASKQNDYYRFAKYCNAGYEPNKHGKYLTQVIKKKDSTNEKFSIQKIPKKWRYLFLDKPISAKVMNIKIEQKIDKFDNEKYYITIVTLNKGSKDKVRIGTEFYDKKMEKSIKITKIFDTRSIGTTYYEFKVNELVKTNWK